MNHVFLISVGLLYLAVCGSLIQVLKRRVGLTPRFTRSLAKFAFVEFGWTMVWLIGRPLTQLRKLRELSADLKESGHPLPAKVGKSCAQ